MIIKCLNTLSKENNEMTVSFLLAIIVKMVPFFVTPVIPLKRDVSFEVVDSRVLLNISYLIYVIVN